ncbi:acyl-CoA thioesterase [Dokdonia sinensis]|uniref:Acyl-CoA thioesterase n=1 Tax=Dokdonia sinensis TaxID=2479847 RepID=A0A3M0GF73_9FLAO|nr:thioesterase family protein [Dokdonia sinensis]RMB63380.1 acyl-CoA thioesterase [Dokdonia sinensis]
MSSSFEYYLTVPAGAIDVLGHVNNVVYLDWVQIAASKHWNHATKEYFKDSDQNAERIGIEKMAWVVMNHYIEYKTPAMEGDEIVVTTTVKNISGATSERHTQIRKKGEDKILVTAVTNWCLLKMPDARPMRVPQEIIALF